MIPGISMVQYIAFIKLLWPTFSLSPETTKYFKFSRSVSPIIVQGLVGSPGQQGPMPNMYLKKKNVQFNNKKMYEIKIMQRYLDTVQLLTESHI